MVVGISIEQVERAEAEAWFALEAAMPEPLRSEQGLVARRTGGAVVLSVRADMSGYWSQTLGLGHDEPVTAELMTRICRFYREQNTPAATIQLASALQPDDWEAICARESLTRGRTIVQLVAEVQAVLAKYEGFARLEPELRLEPISPAHARSWATMTVDVFGSQLAGIPEMFEACVGRRGWHVFGVWHGNQLVSGGLSVAVDGVALLFAGATRPGFRGRGAQSALIVARARAAAQAGCRWLVTQTETEGPGTHNSSLHNLLRLGFEAVYERPGWALKP